MCWQGGNQAGSDSLSSETKHNLFVVVHLAKHIFLVPKLALIHFGVTCTVNLTFNARFTVVRPFSG